MFDRLSRVLLLSLSVRTESNSTAGRSLSIARVSGLYRRVRFNSSHHHVDTGFHSIIRQMRLYFLQHLPHQQSSLHEHTAGIVAVVDDASVFLVPTTVVPSERHIDLAGFVGRAGQALAMRLPVLGDQEKYIGALQKS